MTKPHPSSAKPDAIAKWRGVSAVARLGCPTFVGFYFTIASTTTPRRPSYTESGFNETLLLFTGTVSLVLAIIIAVRVITVPTSPNRTTNLMSWIAFALYTPLQLWLLLHW